MNDRELLELAAKAAGLPVDFESEVNGFYANGYNEFGDVLDWWSPLKDDGDALRLAVKLSLEIDICRTGIAVRTPTGVKVLIDSDEVENGYEATRRAIVRAAAEIGKTAQTGDEQL